MIRVKRALFWTLLVQTIKAAKARFSCRGEYIGALGDGGAKIEIGHLG